MQSEENTNSWITTFAHFIANQFRIFCIAIGERVGHEAVDITYHYAHLFPTVQTDMAAQLETEREALVNVRKE